MDLTWLIADFEYIARLLLAAVLGCIIGVERELRMKEAGVRTHLIVALAACLMTLVSKYGFVDLLHLQGVGFDPSRVAAGVVTALGFLGAGIILTRGGEVSGLTTAAGVWATLGVGMAAGAGMYVISGAAALLILLFQTVLYRLPPLLRRPPMYLIRVVLTNTEQAPQLLHRALDDSGLTPVSLRLGRCENGDLEIRAELQPPRGCNALDALGHLMQEPFVKSVEW